MTDTKTPTAALRRAARAAGLRDRQVRTLLATVKPDSLLDDAGEVDADAVDAAITAAEQGRPGLSGLVEARRRFGVSAVTEAGSGTAVVPGGLSQPEEELYRRYPEMRAGLLARNGIGGGDAA